VSGGVLSALAFNLSDHQLFDRPGEKQHFLVEKIRFRRRAAHESVSVEGGDDLILTAPSKDLALFDGFKHLKDLHHFIGRIE